MTKKVCIIGAGLAGLSTGIYLQQDGIDTEIFERAPWVGGMCAAWSRKGYRFDGCIYGMIGTRQGEPILNLYKEVGALTDDSVIYNTDSMQLEIQGARFVLPMELGKFKRFLLSLSVEDTDVIDEFCRGIDVILRAKLMLGTPSSLKEIIDLLKYNRGFLRLKRKYLAKPVREIVNGFKSDIIRDILTMLMPGEYSSVALFVLLGTRMGGNAGYPMGGASDIIKHMEDKYKELGGKINVNSKVDEIIVADGRAKGIRSKEAFYPSDGVVAACDANDTLVRLLGGKYKQPHLIELLKNAALFEPLAIVSFGLDKRFDIPFSVICACPEGFEVAPNDKRYRYNLRSFEFDRTSAPPDSSSVMVMFDAPLDYWTKLRTENPVSYKIRKEYLAEHIASELDLRYPGFKDAIAVVDVATPATYARLTNVYKGSFEGFAPTPEALKMEIKKTIPGLKRFCMCGQWTKVGGGICTAIADGKTAAKMMKKEIKW